MSPSANRSLGDSVRTQGPQDSGVAAGRHSQTKTGARARGPRATAVELGRPRRCARRGAEPDEQSTIARTRPCSCRPFVSLRPTRPRSGGSKRCSRTTPILSMLEDWRQRRLSHLSPDALRPGTPPGAERPRASALGGQSARQAEGRSRQAPRDAPEHPRMKTPAVSGCYGSEPCRG